MYEDNHLLVVNKPVNMLSQGDITGKEDLQTILKTYLKQKYQKPGNVFLALVQRLDRQVGGLMVLARTSKAASRLSAQLRKQSFAKKYLAVVESGTVAAGHLTHYLRKDHKNRKAVISKKEVPGTQKAILEAEHLGSVDGFSLISVTLLTGRFHQIRSQLSASGMPVAGDRKYGSKTFGTSGIALICNELGFQHPVRDEWMDFKLDMPPGKPWDLFSEIYPGTVSSPDEKTPPID